MGGDSRTPLVVSIGPCPDVVRHAYKPRCLPIVVCYQHYPSLMIISPKSAKSLVIDALACFQEQINFIYVC